GGPARERVSMSERGLPIGEGTFRGLSGDERSRAGRRRGRKASAPVGCCGIRGALLVSRGAGKGWWVGGTWGGGPPPRLESLGYEGRGAGSKNALLVGIRPARFVGVLSARPTYYLLVRRTWVGAAADRMILKP